MDFKPWLCMGVIISYGKEDNVYFTCQTNNKESSCTNCFIDLPSSFQLEPSG